VTADPRLERLRSLDTEATPGPWETTRWHRTVFAPNAPYVADFRLARDAALTEAMRNAWPAVVTLVEMLLAAHVPETDWRLTVPTYRCSTCGHTSCIRVPCRTRKAVLAVLDTFEEAS
jgi:hypothetical protein